MIPPHACDARITLANRSQAEGRAQAGLGAGATAAERRNVSWTTDPVEVS